MGHTRNSVAQTVRLIMDSWLKIREDIQRQSKRNECSSSKQRTRMIPEETRTATPRWSCQGGDRRANVSCKSEKRRGESGFGPPGYTPMPRSGPLPKWKLLESSQQSVTFSCQCRQVFIVKGQWYGSPGMVTRGQMDASKGPDGE